MKIIVDIDDKEEVEKVQSFLKELSLSYRLEPEYELPDEGNSTKLLEFLRTNPVEDDISERIPDPVKWQRGIRKDRKLPFRQDTSRP